MTHNEFIVCTTCCQTLNLRIQMGNYPIPFNVYCPECSTHISGKIDFEPEYKISLVNGEIKEVQPDFPYWCIELSAEFPSRKFYLRKSEKITLTPYMNMVKVLNLSNVNNLKMIEVIQDSMRFANYCESEEFNNLIRLYELFWNYKYDYLFPQLGKSLQEYKEITPLSEANISNALDAMMVLHQMLLTTTGINTILNEDLTEYTEISEKLVKSEHREEILEYATYLAPKYNKIEKKGLDLLKDFAEIYPQIMPAVTLKNSNAYDTLDQDNYGISTIDYEKLTSFYGKSYEWILDNIDLCIGLNNIYARGSYQKGYGKTPDKYKDYHEKLEKISIKYNKIEQYVREDEPFSKPMTNIDNKIRNAIQHYTNEVDYVHQTITFEDKNHKGNVSALTRTFLDFAILCLENISLVFYILEISYNLRKFYLTSAGLNMTLRKNKEKEIYASPNIKKQPRHTVKTPGRNDMCPCGSNKKYKNCCDKFYPSLD